MFRTQLIRLALLLTAAPLLANEDEGRIVTVSPASITIGKKHPNTCKITTATATRPSSWRPRSPTTGWCSTSCCRAATG